MRPAYDAVVIGGGHNGLVAAAYLARAGMTVGVFERRKVVGGAAVTEELWKGFKVSRLSYSYGLFDPRIVRELNLKEMGLRIIPSELDLFVPFPDGKSVFIWADAERTAKGLRAFSPKDSRNYLRYLAFWKHLNEIMGPLKYSRRLTPSEFLGRFEKFGALDDLRTILFGSLSELLDEYFESEYVRAAICPRGLIGTFVGPESPGSAYVLAYHVMGESGGEAGTWGWLAGGMGALSEMVAAAARRLGVEIFTGRTVKRVLVVDGRARGVELSDGTKVKSDYLLSNADPKQTLLKLVGKENLDRGFVKGVSGIADEGCVVKVNAALRGLPDYKAQPGAGPQHRAITSIGPSVQYCERAFDDAKYGRPSRHPFLRVGHHSANDPTMAPKGKHVMSIFSQYFPYHLASGSWDEIREEVGDVIIDTLSEYAPNIKGSIIAREVLTPLDLERVFSLPKGNIFHMEITPDQMFFMRPLPGWSNYETPIEGLYLCGSGARPGGGVTGLPGYNAARAVIADRGKKKKK